jgi:hypothetical protein
MPYTITLDEYPELDSVPLATSAWYPAEGGLSDLYGGPEVRGDDLLIPYLAGLKPVGRIAGALHAVIPMIVLGGFAPDGSVNSDERTGLASNIDILTALCLPPALPAATKPFVFHRVDGDRHADCEVVGPFAPQDVDSGVATGIIEIVIPSGIWVVGS